MERTIVLVSGALSWTVTAVVAAAHAASGDLLVPAVMAAVLVVWVGLRRQQLRLLRTTA
jgi:hypothetical protein